MPAKIGREKESKIIRLHLQKVSQTKIAREVDASQSTVSATISRFKNDASNTSLDAASKSRGVGKEIDELRSLYADLRKAGIDVTVAKKGCGLYEELNKIGVDLDKLDSLLAVYKKMGPKEFPIQDFFEATVRMIQLEKEFGISYKDVLLTYKEKQARLKDIEGNIKDGTEKLAGIVQKKADAKSDLLGYLEEKQLTLERVEKALKIRENMEKAGLSMEESEPVGVMLRIFSNLIEEKSQSPDAAAAELQKFLSDAKNLEEARKKVQNKVDELTGTRDALVQEVRGLVSEKEKLSLENKFLKEAIENVLELREKHGMGVHEIARMRSLAQKYGSPASMLEALDTYKFLREIEDRKAAVEGSVEELTLRETSLKSKIKTVEEALAALPGKTDESIKGVKSTLGQLSDEVKGLGKAIKNGSNEVLELKNRALDAGREISAVESQVKNYKLTSRLINIMAKAEGEEADIVEVTTGFLIRLSEWVDTHPKYSEIKQQIELLRDRIMRQQIRG